MKCNPLSWLWGLLPLALLAWVAWLAETPRIEKDLLTRSASALQQKGLAWAEPSFIGRNGLVAGRALEESEQKQAANVVAGVWGVSSVTDKTDVLELIKNYTWSAQARDNNVRLSGYVPSEAVRKEIMGTAKATFPGRNIDDQMKLARGAPEQNRWLGGITFGMKQLAQLKNGGKVDMEGPAFAIEGEAENANGYNGVKTALANGLPQGISLKSEKVVAPAVKPYTWAASHKGNQVELSGHAPNARVRDQVVAEAKKSFPGATVVDKMVMGSGEPADWQKVTTTALGRLAQLKEGRSDLRDSQLNVTGIAEREDLIDAVRRSLKSDVPASFKVADAITLDPGVKAEEEARRAAAEAAQRTAAAAEAARKASEEQAQRSAAADEATRRAAADEAARRAAAEAEAKRVADLQRRQAEEQAKLKLADDAAKRAAADDAAKKAAAEEAARRAAAEDAARRASAERVAAEAVARQREALNTCQESLRVAARGGRINFERASAELDQGSYATLNKLAEIAKTCPDAQIEIAGHTDAEGDPLRNQRLSERRAKSVADYLAKAGVPDGRLISAGYGDTQPVASNASAEDRAKNRRIEFNVKVK